MKEQLDGAWTMLNGYSVSCIVNSLCFSVRLLGNLITIIDLIFQFGAAEIILNGEMISLWTVKFIVSREHD